MARQSYSTFYKNARQRYLAEQNNQQNNDADISSSANDFDLDTVQGRKEYFNQRFKQNSNQNMNASRIDQNAFHPQGRLKNYNIPAQIKSEQDKNKIQERLDAIDNIRKTAKDRNQEDLNNLPEGAFDYIESNKKTSKLNDVIYRATLNKPSFQTINDIAAIAKSNVSEELQSKYGMDKDAADYYEKNWKSISENKKASDYAKEQSDALSNMDEKEYDLLKTYSKSMSTLKFATNPKIQQEEIKARQDAREQLKTEYGLSENDIERLADYVSRDVNRQYNTKLQTEANEMSKTGLGRAALRAEALAVAPAAGITSAVDALTEKLTGRSIDIYSDGKMLSNLQNAAETNVSEAVKEKYGDKVRFVNDVLMSVGESAETMGIGAGVAEFLGLAGTSAEMAAKIASYPLFSSGAFAATLRDKIESGQNEDQAFAYATATGIAEGLFEEISFDKLQKVAHATGKVGIVEFVKKLLKQGFYEGTEEINTEIANTIADALINADYSDLQLNKYNYVSQGYSEEEASKLATKDLKNQILESGLAGALSGILMGAGAGVVQHHNYKKMGTSSTEKTLQKAVDVAMNSEIASESTAREIAQKLSDEGRTVDTLSNSEKAQLFESLGSLQNEEINNSINAALESRIENEDTLNKAKALFEEYRNTNMNDAQFEEELVNHVAKNSKERNAILEARDEAFTVNDEINPITNTLRNVQTDKQIDLHNKAIQKEIAKQDKAANKQFAKFEKAVSSKEKYAAAKGVAEAKVSEGKNETTTKVLKVDSLKGSENTTIVLEGGKSVALKNVTFSDQNLGKLYNDIASSLNSVSVANAALNNYKGQEVESYVNAYRVVYELGRQAVRTNKDANWLLNNALDSYIVSNMGGASIASEIFYKGKNDAENYAKVKESIQGKKENQTFNNKSNAEDILNTESEIKHLLAAISEKTGVKISELSTIKDNDGNYNTAILGSFLENVITLNSEGKNEVQTLLHELMEKMKLENQEGYNLIVSEVIDYVQATKGSTALIDSLQKYQRAYAVVEGLSSTEDIADEYANDFVAGILTSSEGLHDLATWATNDNPGKARNLFETIAEFFSKILDELTRYMDAHKSSMNLGTKEGFEATGKRIETLRQTVLNELEKMGQQSTTLELEYNKEANNRKEVINNQLSDRKFSIEVKSETKDATLMTESDLRYLLDRIYPGMELESKTYIPLRISTPQIFIDTVEKHSEGKIKVMNLPMASSVEHLYQNMEEDDGSQYGSTRPHGFDADDIVEISKKMGDPNYIVYQVNGRYAEVVSFKNKRNKKVIVSISIATEGKNYKHSRYMNGYREGYYNIIVTEFEPDNLESYLKNNEVIYDKKKNDINQVGSGSIISITHDSPFFTNNDITFSNKVNDNEYLELAKNPKANADKLQEMVDKAAKEAPTENPDIRYSVDVDSTGKRISKEQAEFFKDSKVRDDEGKLQVMYHGTPNATFTKFKSGTYFTSNKEYADKYQSPTASSISTKRTVDNPDTYKVYLNITKPFDTRLPEVRKIWDEQYYHKWDTGELTDEGILDWTAVEGVRDFIEENELDFDGIIADEGSTGGYGEDVNYRGLSYIVMNPNQVKNVDNVNPTKDPDIRFSVDIPEYNFSDTVAFYGTDEEIEAAEKKEQEIKNVFKGIIEEPDFKALRYKTNTGSYKLLHRSTYPGVDWQLSLYDDKGGIGHVNYYATNMDKLYNDLMVESLFLKDRSLEVLPEDIENRRFSVEVDDDLSIFEAIIAENEDIKEASNVIKNTVQSIGQLNIKAADIKKMASGIKAEWKTNASIEDITDSLTSVFNYMNQKNVDYDSLVQIMSEIAKPMLENATNTKSTRSDSWDKFSQYLRNTKIKLTYGQIREVTSEYGSTDNYRKRLFGITTISREATMNLDEMWSELVDASGNILPASVTAENQPAVLLETIEGLKPQVVTENTYGMNLEQASYDLALDIYRRFFELQALSNKSEELQTAIGKVKTRQIANRRKAVEKYKEKLAEQKKLLAEEKKKNIKKLADEIKTSDEALQKALQNNDEVAAAIIEDLKNKNNKKIEQIRKQKDDQIAKIKASNFDARMNERERRKNTALKEQLKNQTNALNKMLKSPNVAGFVKVSMVRGTIDVLEAINLDTGKSQGMKEKLQKLSEMYDRYKKDNTFDFDYDENTHDMINELRDTFDGRNYTELSNDELQRVVELVTRLKKQIQNANKLLQNEKYTDAARAATDIISEVNASKGSLNSKLSKKIDNYLSYQLNAYRWFRKTSGYKDDGALMNVYDQLDQGQMKMIMMQKEINDMFAPLLEGKENQENVRRLSSIDEKDLVDIGLKVNGKTVKVTRGMMLSFLMHLQNDDNTRHLVLGGFTVPELKAYKNGKMQDAFEKTQIGEFFTIQELKDAADNVKHNKKDAGFEDGVNVAIKTLQNKAKKLRRNLSEWELSYLETAEKLFHQYYGEKINEVSVETRGYALAQTKNYYPIRTDKKFTRTEFAALKQDGSLEGLGFLKERVKASNPIMLEDIGNVILRQTDNTSRYYGFSIPVRNVNMVMNMKFNNRNSPESAISDKWGNYNLKLFEKIMQDVQTGRGTDDGIGQIFTALRGNFAAATLTANIGVAMKQAASFPTAAAVLGWKPLGKALKDVGKGFTKKGITELEEINPLLWYRSKGQSSADINYAKQSDVYKYLDDKAPIVKAISVDLIQNVDSATVRTLEYASMYYVDENFNDLKKGSDEYWNKVSDTFTKVIQETQPNYTVLQRPEVLKSKNELVRQLFMFKTQPLQNLGIIYDALGQFSTVKSKYAKESAEYKAAVDNVSKAISSQIVAAVVFSAMTVLSNVLYHKLYKYDKDDDKSMIEEMMLAFAGGVASTLSSMILAGDWIYNAVSSLLFGTKNYGVEVSIAETINNTFDVISNYKEYGIKLVEAETETDRQKALNKLITNTEDVLVSMGQYVGIPVNNVKNAFISPFLYIKDIVNGVPLGSSNLAWDETVDSMNMKMFEALLDDNMDRYNKLYAQQLKASDAKDPEKSIHNKIKSMLKEAYAQKEITADEVLKYLNAANIDYDADIIDEWDYKNETGATSYSKYSRLKDAINNSYENKADRAAIKQEIDKLIKEGTDKSAVVSVITTEYKKVYLKNKSAELKNLLISCYMSCGLSRDEAIKKINNWK